MECYVRAKRYKADVPFKATVIKKFYDGTEGHFTMTGVYKGVQVNNAFVTWSRDEPLCECILVLMILLRLLPLSN